MIKQTIALVAAAGFFLGSAAAMAVPTTKADHLAAAQKYESLAAKEQANVKEHTQMKQEYRANQAAIAKGDREKSLSEMDKHCDSIISNAKKLSDEYSAIAQWHKLRAQETGN